MPELITLCHDFNTIYTLILIISTSQADHPPPGYPLPFRCILLYSCKSSFCCVPCLYCVYTFSEYIFFSFQPGKRTIRPRYSHPMKSIFYITPHLRKFFYRVAYFIIFMLYTYISARQADYPPPQGIIFNGINLSLLDVSMTGVLSNMNKQRPCYGAGEPCLALCA